MADEVKVKLTVEEKDALKSLGKLSKSMDKFGDEAKNAAQKSDTAFKKFKDGIVQGFGVGGGLAVVNTLTNSFKNLFNTLVVDGIKAAQVQEDAINQLNQSLKNAGTFSQEASQDFQDFASEMQKVSTVGDEVTLQYAALARNFTNSNEEAKNLTKAAIELSAATGMSLESAIKNLGKTFAGLTGELGESIPALRNLTAEQLKAGKAIDFVLERFGGSALAKTQTYSGAVAQLSNSFGDLTEEFGKAVTGSEDIVRTINSLSKGFQDASKWITENKRLLTSLFEQLTNSPTLLPGKILIKALVGEGPETIDTINEKITETSTKIAEIRSKIKNGDNSIFGSLFGSEEELKESLRLAQEHIMDLKSQRASMGREGGDGEEGSRAVKEKEENQKILDQRAALFEQLNQLELDKKIIEEEQKAIEKETGLAEREAAIEAVSEFEQKKAEIAFNAGMEKNKLITDIESKRLNEAGLTAKKEIAIEKAKIKEKKRLAELEKQVLMVRLQAAQGFLAAGLTLAKKGSVAQKAMQTTQAVISTYSAATQALASPPGPPFTIPLAASVVAQGLANVIKINSQSFAHGGVVGGFQSATSGPDNTVINARRGEMVLNAGEQKQLFDIATGKQVGSGSDEILRSMMNQPIVIEIEGREIARTVRDQRELGYAV